mgnify:CR=1 FL=1
MDARALLSPEEEYQKYTEHNNDVDDPGYRNFVKPLVDLISSRHDKATIGLDFGAGPGPVISKMLGERGYHLNLYDPFFHPDTQVLQRTYDYIVCCEVAEHFYNPYESFKLLSSLLSSDGTLYCRTTLIPEVMEFSRWHYKNDKTHVFFYDRRTIAWIAQEILNCSYSIVTKNIIYFTRQDS